MNSKKRWKRRSCHESAWEIMGEYFAASGIKRIAPICPPISAEIKVIPRGLKILPSTRERLKIGMNAMIKRKAQRRAGPMTSCKLSMMVFFFDGELGLLSRARDVAK